MSALTCLRGRRARGNGENPFGDDGPSVIEALAALDDDGPRAPSPVPAAEPLTGPRQPDVLPERTPLFDSLFRPALPCVYCGTQWTDPDAGSYRRVFSRLRKTAADAGWEMQRCHWMLEHCGCCWACGDCVAQGRHRTMFPVTFTSARAEHGTFERTRMHAGRERERGRVLYYGAAGRHVRAIIRGRRDD